jgi:hypothetical protein
MTNNRSSTTTAPGLCGLCPTRAQRAGNLLAPGQHRRVPFPHPARTAQPDARRVGVRIEVLRGDRQAAIERLDEAAKVAQTLSLNRLRAMVENQRSAWDFLRFLNSMRSR